MKVRINYTVHADDDLRRQINEWYGRPGLATRQQVQSWYRQNGESMDDDLYDLAGRAPRDSHDVPRSGSESSSA